MDATKLSFTAVAPRAGLLISATLIAYFLIMKFLGLTHISELRFLNVLILVGGLILTMNKYRASSGSDSIPYFKGLGLGIMTAFFSFAFFTLFLLFYFTLVDPLLLLKLGEESLMLGPTPSASYAALAVMVEGVASGVIVSFILMQYYKSNYSKEQKEA